MTRSAVAAAIAVAWLVLAAPAGAATFPAGFEDRTVVDGLSQPVAVDWAADGRAFIVEKPGRLLVLQPGAPAATELLDISEHVNDYGDRGLVGVAVDRDFASNGYVYLAYVYELQPLVPDSTAPMVSRLTRITVLPDGTVENPASPETVLLGSYDDGPCPSATNALDCIPADSESHTIGSVRSDPRDGTLWVGAGDGADFNAVDPKALRTLDPKSLAGKILHLDREGRGLPGHASCPSNDNLDHVCTKVFAQGFRNPFRFHLRADAGVSLGDVGWNTREEIDLVPTAGKSYGWPCYEGSIRTPGYEDLLECEPFYAREGGPQAQRGPSFEYGRDEGAAIIGGPTYTGVEYPAGYRDSLFYGDFVSNSLRRLSFDAQGRPSSTTFATGWFGTDLELGPQGDLHYVDFGTGLPGTGSLRRVVYTPGNASPRAVSTASPTGGDPPLTVQLSAAGSSDPDGDRLSYSWDFGDGSPPSDAASPTHVYAAGRYTARLTVSDGRGLTGSSTVTITPGSTAPQVFIDAPAAGSSYRGGDSIALRGHATDAEEGDLPGSRLDWTVRLVHRDHVHPISELRGRAQASFVAGRDHDADSHYQITLTATDSFGLTSAETVALTPEAVDLLLRSEPVGAPISYGGRAAITPYAQPTAVGYETTVSAASSFISGGREYRFEGWSDGGARLHGVTVPGSDLTLTARYVPVASPGPGAGPGPSSRPALPLDPRSTPPSPGRPQPSPEGRYVRAIRSTRSLASFFGLGDSDRLARDGRGGRGGRYRGDPRRAPSLIASLGDGGARIFDGRDDYVALPASALGRPRALTVELWVRRRAGRAQRAPDRRAAVLLSAARDPGADGFALLLDRDGRPRAVAAVASSRWASVTGPRLRRGRIHHLAATYDGQRVRLFVDGRPSGSRPYAGGIRWRAGRTLLAGGGAGRRGPRAFAGRLDELALFRRALTPAEIQRHWIAR